MKEIPSLKPSPRNREFNAYSNDQINQIVYKFLFEGNSHRALDQDVLGLDPSLSRGYQAMGILHHLGLVNSFKGLFMGKDIEEVIIMLSKMGKEYIPILERLRVFHKLPQEDFQGFFPRNITIKPLIKNIGSSQYTDGVRIEKKYHGIFNPPNSEFYTKRGTARTIWILFNNRIFKAEYRYEGQKDENVQLQSIRFRKDLKAEFAKVFPNSEGLFSISVGRDFNHFIFDIQSKVELPDDIEEQEYSEGKSYYKQHIARERNPKLMEAAKALFVKKHGSLYCEVCHFNFYDHYGERGKEFIEGHHVKYISEMDSGEKTKISDIVMLCPNCHRMIHRKPKIDIQGLKALYHSSSSD